jgi:hypothetical protein
MCHSPSAHATCQQGPAPQHHQSPLHERPSHVSLSPVRHRRHTPMALGRARCVGMAPHTTAPPTGIGQYETGAPLVWDQAGHRSAQTPVHRTLAPLRRGASPSASPNHGRRGKIPARRGGNKIVEHGVSLPERGLTTSLEASMDHWKPIFLLASPRPMRHDAVMPHGGAYATSGAR